jgi:hypothetical protein
MCPACLTAAAITAAKLASAGALGAYGGKKWLARAAVPASDAHPSTTPSNPGDPHDDAENRIR